MAVNFIDEAGSDLNKFIMTREDGTEETVYLRRDATITQVGTPLNAENLNKLQSDMLAAIAAQSEAVYYGVCSAYTQVSNYTNITTNLDNFDKTKVSLVYLTSTIAKYFQSGLSARLTIRNSTEQLGLLKINNKNFHQLPANATIICLWDKKQFNVIEIIGSDYSINDKGIAIMKVNNASVTSGRSGTKSLSYPDSTSNKGAIVTPHGTSGHSFIGGCIVGETYQWYGNSEDDIVTAISYISYGTISLTD